MVVAISTMIKVSIDLDPPLYKKKVKISGLDENLMDRDS